jgi:hypothetical protein
MTFEHGWVLIFLLLPVAWAWFEMRRTRRIAALAPRIGAGRCHPCPASPSCNR